jgi:hypothetical protein
MVGQAPARCFHPAFFVKNIIGPSQPFDVAIPAFRESQRKRPLRGLIPRTFARKHRDSDDEVGGEISTVPRDVAWK